MLAIFKRTKNFLADVATGQKSTDAAGNEVAAHKQARFFAPKGSDPIHAPEWIRETLTFKVGVIDGSIIEIRPADPKVAQQIAEATGAEPKEDDPADSKPPKGTKPGKDKTPPADPNNPSGLQQ